MKRQRIDFLGVKQAITIFQVAELLKLSVKREGNTYRCPCPTGRGGDRAIEITAGYQNKDGSLGAFRCHGCKVETGDLIGLYAHAKNVSNYDAATALMDAFGIGNDKPEKKTTDHAAQPDTGPMKSLDYLEPEHPVIEMLGLERSAMEALGAGYAPRGTMRGRILIPLRLPDGALVGYMAIATDTEQTPLLKFPDNLAERCQVKPQPREQADDKSPDQLRKLFRVVG